MIKYLSLHPTLPTGFYSWTQVLTDWAVSRAYLQTGRHPSCLADRPALAAALVAEVGAAIRQKQLMRRAVEIAVVQEAATEPAYDHAGGPAYLDLSAAMNAAQERYLEAYRRCRASADEAATAELVSLRTEMERRQTAFRSARRARESFVAATRTATVRAYWSARPVRGIPDTFFADAPPHTAAARMQRIHPPWWGAFLGRLQAPLAHGHPAAGCLLDILPQLRRDARRKKLSALLTEWHEAHADRWGLFSEIHYRMLARRAARKAAQVAAWFDASAPRYRTSEAVRFALHAELADRLAAADPWAVAVPTRYSGAWLSEHGPN